MKRIDELAGQAEYSEKSIESYLVRRVKALGGKCIKFSNPSEVGYPDRIVVLPYGITFWVELKSHGKTPRAIQLARHTELRLLGQTVYVADSRQMIDDILAHESTLIEYQRIKEKLNQL